MATLFSNVFSLAQFYVTHVPMLLFNVQIANSLKKIVFSFNLISIVNCQLSINCCITIIAFP